MNGNAIKLHVAYTDDKEVVLAAASSTRNKLAPRFLAWLEPDMQNDEDVVCAALQNGASIKYASTRLQGNLRCGRVAVAHTGLILEHLSDKLRKHRGLVLAACKQNGMALQYAHPAFKDDEEVVLVACRSDAYAVRFVSPRLRKSERVFLAACTNLKRGALPTCFHVYVQDFNANFKTTPPSNKVVKQFIEKDLIRTPTVGVSVTKSMVMWLIKTNPEVAVKFLDEHGVRANLDFARKCVSSNWNVYGVLRRHFLQLTDEEQEKYLLMSDHEVQLLRSAAVAGFGAAKAAAVHWMGTSVKLDYVRRILNNL